MTDSDPELPEEVTKDFKKDWEPKWDWGRANGKEDAVEQKKKRAAVILDNYQLLMKYALANDQTIPATRVYFTKVAAGASPDPIIKDWFHIET